MAHAVFLVYCGGIWCSAKTSIEVVNGLSAEIIKNFIFAHGAKTLKPGPKA